MTHLKKSLALLLAIVMIFSSMSVAVSAADVTSGSESAAFTVKFFRKNSSGNWVETTKAAPGEHIKARVYVSTNFYSASFASNLLFDSDFFKAVQVTEKNGETTIKSLPQSQLITRTSNEQYVVLDENLLKKNVAIDSTVTYMGASDFAGVKSLISKGKISSDLLQGKDMIFSSIKLDSMEKTVKFTDADSNYFEEIDFIVNNDENAITKQVGKEGVANVPAELRFNEEYFDAKIRSAGLLSIPKGEAGALQTTVQALGLGWEISDDNFSSTPAKLTTTSSYVLDANGGKFNGGKETTEIKGIIKQSIYNDISSSEATPLRANFTLIGWSPIKTARGADITDEILTAIGFADMSSEEIAALGWKHTEALKLNGYLPDTEIGTVLTADMISEIELNSKSATQLKGYGLNVTSEILEKLVIDKANTLYDYEEHTLYALWDNSGLSKYTVETYLMDTNGNYPTEPTYRDEIPDTAGKTVLLQATTREGFTLDKSSEDGTPEKSSESVKVEADGSSVLKAYYTRNKYTVTYKYEDSTGKHEVSDKVFYDALVPKFNELPAKEINLYLVDGDGNKTIDIPKKMPAEDITILAEQVITYVFDAGENAVFPTSGERTQTYVYKFGDVPTEPEEPKKDGYSFVGWDKDIPSKAEGNMSFKAMFNPLEGTEADYTVTFHDASGAVIDSADGYWYGYEFNAVDIPEGYGENVWKLADGKLVSFPYTIKEDTDFYAISEDANVYNAYFYESKTDSRPYAIEPTAYGEEISAPAEAPQKTGSRFLGWSTNPDATEAEELGVMDSMEGKKFYAVFELNSVTLTFDAKGGTTVAPISGKYGDEYSIPTTTKTGYEFIGWYDGDNKQVVLTGTLPAASAAYTAKWAAKTYNIVYKNGDMLVGDIEKAKTDTTVDVRDGKTVVKEGYTFAGWKSSADGVVYNNPSAIVQIKSFTMPAKDVTLEAQWIVNKHVIMLNPNGGAFADTSDNFAYDDVAYGTALSTVVPADPQWDTDEKTFAGWADADSINNEVIYAPGELQKATMPNKSLNLIAVWNDVVAPKYNATFITASGAFSYDGSTPVKEVTQEYEAGDLITPPVPTRTDGEYTYTWVPSLPTGNIMPARDMTFVAQWEAVVPGSIEYTITPMIEVLKEDGTTEYVTGTVLTKTGDEGEQVEITVDGISEAKYSWIYSGLITGASNVPDPENVNNVLKITLSEDGDNALVAYFKLTKKNIKLDANGGTFAEDIKANQDLYYGSSIELPSADEITKDKYVLVGWVNSDGRQFAPGATVAVTDSEEYDAVWQEKTYTLTFNENGGLPELVDPTLAEGEVYYLPAISKENYRFNGWLNDDGTLYTAGYGLAMPAYSMQLTANWTRLYTVTYNDVNGNASEEYSVPAGANIPLYSGAEPAKDNYKFTGWDNMPESGLMPEADIVLNPTFSKLYTLTYAYETADDSLPVLPASEKLIAGAKTTVKALPKLENYRFTGWTYDGDTYEPGEAFVMPAKDAELVVVAEEIVKYDLTFNENGGSEVDDVELEQGDHYTLPASYRDGFVLKGWSDGVNDPVPAGEGYEMPDFDVVLTAVWEREITTAAPTTAPTYYIGFVYDGSAPAGADALDTNIPVKGGETYILPGLSSVDGVEFDYWYDSKGVKYPSGYEYPVTGNMTFTAKWTVASTSPVPTEPTTPANYYIQFAYEDNIGPDGAPDLPEAIYKQDGESFNLPALPSLDGFAFDGWYNEDGVRYPAGYNYTVKGDVVFTAKWSAKTTEPTTEPTTTEPTTRPAVHILRFEYESPAPVGAPELPTPVELREGQKYELPTPSDISGYEFKGWKEESGDATYAAGYKYTMPDSNVTLYAAFEEVTPEPVKYKLTFNSNGGSAVSAKDLSYGEKINLPKTTRENYEFMGWSDGTTVYAVGEEFTMPNSDAVLTAQWKAIEAKKCTVKYAYIGDETPVNAGKLPDDEVINEGTKAKVKAYPAAVEGYEFYGWYLNGVKYAPNQEVEITSDPAVFEGFWVKKTEKYIVSYQYVGNVPADADVLPVFSSYENKQSVTVAPVPTAVEGYTFEGWFVGTDRTTPVTSITIDGEDVSLVGVWSINKHDVVLDADGGTFAENSSSQYIADDVAFGTDIDSVLPEIPVKEGYTFVKWDGMPEDGKMPDNDVNLTAKWEINEYTIQFNTNGGSTIPDAKYNFGERITKPADPTREGFEFAGWDQEIPATMPARNLIFNAKWTPKSGVETFTFVADANGGTFADGKDKYTNEYAAGETIAEISEPTKEGFTFKGWDGMPEDGKMPAEDLTVYANWEADEPVVKKHTVNYFLVKGEGATAEPYTSKMFAEGETMTHPSVSVEGFTFKGWTDADGNPLATTMGTEDINAYAQLEINSYKVTYLMDSTGTVYKEYKDVKFASEVPVPADPSKEGFVFAGWEPTVVSTMPSHDLTYTAKWVTAPVQGDEYTATYIVDGKTYKSYVLKEGEVIPVPDAPTKFGYVFVGWDPEVPETMPAENVEFTAKWEIDKTFIGIVIGGTVVSGAVVGTVIGINTALITGASIVGGIIVIVGAVHLAKHTHTVTYIVDGEVYKVYKVVEGTKIPVPADPTKDGAKFDGWNPEVPDKMGNTDLVFEATWEDAASDTDVIIPDTGSIAGVAAFAVISSAAAAAYVIARKKKEN